VRAGGGTNHRASPRRRRADQGNHIRLAGGVGGVTLERIPELASTGADYVSIGALTHSAPAADLSLELGASREPRRPEPLPAELADGLALTAAARTLRPRVRWFYSEVGSTNDVAVSLAEAGPPRARPSSRSSQTAGRGRLGRDWFSPPGAGLYASVICHHGGLAPYFTLAGGLAVADGIRAGHRPAGRNQMAERHRARTPADSRAWDPSWPGFWPRPRADRRACSTSCSALG
jgi:hypothetical protein